MEGESIAGRPTFEQPARGHCSEAQCNQARLPIKGRLPDNKQRTQDGNPESIYIHQRKSGTPTPTHRPIRNEPAQAGRDAKTNGGPLSQTNIGMMSSTRNQALKCLLW